MQERKLIIIAFLLLTVSTVWAQRDFRKGYIITNQQDTIYGWIDYRGDIRNAKICSFKQTENGQATDYTPSDIAAYRFNDSKFYVSKNIGATDAPKQVFLEYLVNGLAKLYYYRYDNRADHYYIEKDGQVVELKMEVKEVVIDGKNHIKTTRPYIGVLKTTLNVWDMRDEIEKTRLEHASLIDIAKDYHQRVCTDGSECIIYEKKKPLITMRISPMLGVDLSMLKREIFIHRWFIDESGEIIIEDRVDKYKSTPSTNLSVGANLNFSMPRLNEKLYLQMQAMYTKYYFFYAYKDVQESTDVHIRSNTLKLGLSIKYEYPKGKWRPTLAAGAGALLMSSGVIKEVTDHYDLNVEIRPSTVIYDFPVKFASSLEIIPGIHYYLTPKRIIFLQAQYMQRYKDEFFIQSVGLSAGIYF